MRRSLLKYFEENAIETGSRHAMLTPFGGPKRSIDVDKVMEQFKKDEEAGKTVES